MSDTSKMKFSMRAKKTTKGNDDFKVLMVGIVIAITILISFFSYTRLIEQRWFRDVVHITPFEKVVVTNTTITPSQKQIIVNGLMVKRRCTFNELIAYIVDLHGVRYFAVIDTSLENTVKVDRPPSDGIQAWGPWIIRKKPKDIQVQPVGYEIFAGHIECPTEPVTQTNLFTSGRWADMDNSIAFPDSNENHRSELK